MTHDTTLDEVSHSSRESLMQALVAEARLPVIAPQNRRVKMRERDRKMKRRTPFLPERQEFVVRIPVRRGARRTEIGLVPMPIGLGAGVGSISTPTGLGKGDGSIGTPTGLGAGVGSTGTSRSTGLGTGVGVRTRSSGSAAGVEIKISSSSNGIGVASGANSCERERRQKERNKTRYNMMETKKWKNRFGYYQTR